LRTGYLQLVQGKSLHRRAILQQTRGNPICARRGDILDRNKQCLAISGNTEVVGVNCSELRSYAKKNISLESIAQKIGECLNLSYENVLKKISRKTSSEILKRRAEKSETDPLRQYIIQNKITGITIDPDRKRYYPYGALASHIIGFVGDDHQGLWGIEKILDQELKGKPGETATLKNARGLSMPFNNERFIHPQDGNSVILTIDEVIQHFAEKHLDEAINLHKVANGGVCIVMDVKTGELLALATKPTYDLNNPFSIDNIQNENIKNEIKNLSDGERSVRMGEELAKLWKNKAIVDSYEPGSTFKIITTAIGLETGVGDDKFSIHCPGYKIVADRRIRCWKRTGHGTLNFREGLRHSCNPAFLEVGLRIGKKKFIEGFERFGFRRKTGLDFPGETIGIFHNPESFTELDLAISAIGQSFQVTPMQMVSAVGAVANNGKIMKPTLIKQIIDKDGNIIKENHPQVISQVISAELANKLSSMLEGVVSEGGGNAAFIPGYRVGGKTGTGETLPRGNGRYVSSFIGIAPINDPRIVCLFLVDNPTDGQHYGSIVAAPTACKMIEDTLNYLQVPRQYTDEEIKTLFANVPDIVNMNLSQARIFAEKNKLRLKIEGSGNKVVTQIPKPGEKVNVNSFVIAYTQETNDKSHQKLEPGNMTIDTFINKRRKSRET